MPASAISSSDVLLERIQITNLLSFGPQAEELELRPLNVLIGTNGSGKSNFVEAIGLLQAAPTDLAARGCVGRGVADWFWRGEQAAEAAWIDAVLTPPEQRSTHYRLEVAERQQGFTVIREVLEPATTEDDFSYLRVTRGSRSRPEGLLMVKARGLEANQQVDYRQVGDALDTSNSVLAQVKDAERCPELSRVAAGLASIRLYRDWTFGQRNVVRSLQKTDLPNTDLAEDHANLGLVLNRLSRDYAARERIVEALRRLYEDVSDFHVGIEFNTAQLFVQERGGKATVPATRLSDGTIRYLSLLAILCDPQPPPLVCIEGPELGLHPDILPGLAKLLREASERCQLIVTTHSEVLVDALTDEPESIVVCEKENGQTKLKRLSRAELLHGLDKHRLGELWSSGEIGGNRW